MGGQNVRIANRTDRPSDDPCESRTIRASRKPAYYVRRTNETGRTNGAVTPPAPKSTKARTKARKRIHLRHAPRLPRSITCMNQFTCSKTFTINKDLEDGQDFEDKFRMDL